MPTIPGVKEGQGAYTGTPVAGIDTRDSRMMGEAMQQLGGALNEVAKDMQRSAKERDVLVVESMKAQWASKMNSLKDGLADTGFDKDDPDGKKTLARIQSEGLATADQIRAADGITDRARNMFTADINKMYTTKYQPELMLEAGHISTALNKDLRTKTINTTSTLASHNPDEFDSIVADGLMAIQKGPGTVKEKLEAQAALKETAFASTVERFRQNKQYDSAKNFTDIYGTGMDAEKKIALIQKLDDDQWKDYTRERTVKENNRQDQDRIDKEASDKTRATFVAQMASAPDEETRNAVMRDATAAQEAGALQAGDFNQVVSFGEKATLMGDAQYEVQRILGPLNQGTLNTKQAKERLRQDSSGPNPILDARAAARIIYKLEQWEQRQASDPLLRNEMAYAVRTAQGYNKTGTALEKALQGLFDDDREKQRVDNVVSKLYAAGARGVGGDGALIKLAKQLSAGSLGISEKSGFDNIYVPAGLEQDPDKFEDYLLDQKQKGAFKTPAKKRAYVDAMKGIEAQRANRAKEQEAMNFMNQLTDVVKPKEQAPKGKK